jgi:hypothetical protein
MCICEILLQTWENFYRDISIARWNCNSGWGRGLIGQKKAQMSQSKIKVLLVVFFDWSGIVHHEFVPCGQMVNKQLYLEVLAHLMDAVPRKRPEL